jgi:hypothetical protein
MKAGSKESLRSSLSFFFVWFPSRELAKKEKEGEKGKKLVRNRKLATYATSGGLAIVCWSFRALRRATKDTYIYMLTEKKY